MRQSINRSSALLYLVISAACGNLIACASDREQGAELGTTTEPLYAAKSVRFWTQNGNIVPMCWMMPTFTAPPNGIDWSNEKKFIIDIVTATWERESALHFTWEDCPTPAPNLTTQHVRVRLDVGVGGATRVHPGKGLGADLLTADSKPIEHYADGGVNGNDGVNWNLSMGFPMGWNGPSGDISYQQAMILHEFGHVLGFEHEQDRRDKGDASTCEGGYDLWDSGQGMPIGLYDPSSIMSSTYCHSGDTLSKGDIAGLRSIYGSPPDLDGDGLIGKADNCPLTWNQGQENCNKDFELAKRARSPGTALMQELAVEVLGDACDPTPCPAAEVASKDVPGTSTQGLCKATDPLTSFYTKKRDEIVVSPIGAHIRKPPAPTHEQPETPVANVPTKLRFCQPSEDRNIDCRRPDVLQNSKLREDLSATSVLLTTSSEPWLRVGIKESQSGLADREDNVGFPITYANATHKSLFWDYKGDDQFWHRLRNPLDPSLGRLDVVGTNQNGIECRRPALFGGGMCLDGVVWVHGQTSVGENDVDSPGMNRKDLSNFIFRMAPEEPQLKVCYPRNGLEFDDCTFTPQGCLSATFVRMTDCINCALVLQKLTQDRTHAPLVRTTTGVIGGVWKNAFSYLNELGLNGSAYGSVTVSEMIRRRNFVTALESTPALRNQIDAVALPVYPSAQGGLAASSSNESEPYLGEAASVASTAYVTEYLFAPTDSSRGVAWTYSGGGLNPTPPTGTIFGPDVTSVLDGPRMALGRLDPKVLFSRTMGGIFLVGGVNPSNNTPITSVLYEPLNGNRTTLVGTLPQLILAATLTRPSQPGDPTPSYLWTIERTPSDTVSLVLREITRSQVYAPLTTIPLPSAPQDSYRLSVAWDSPDTVLLSVANFGERHWAVFTVGEFGACRDANGGAVPPSCILMRPVVSGDAFGAGGYLFQAAYAEPDALLLPVSRPEDPIGVSIERFARSKVGQNATITPADLRSWMK
jgi:hypothetical protein